MENLLSFRPMKTKTQNRKNDLTGGKHLDQQYHYFSLSNEGI